MTWCDIIWHIMTRNRAKNLYMSILGLKILDVTCHAQWNLKNEWPHFCENRVFVDILCVHEVLYFDNCYQCPWEDYVLSAAFLLHFNVCGILNVMVFHFHAFQLLEKTGCQGDVTLELFTTCIRWATYFFIFIMIKNLLHDE